jgi:hypothetical protein
MSAKNPSIQGLSSPSLIGTQYNAAKLGQMADFKADSSNPFYTTKVSNLVIDEVTWTAPTLLDGLGTLVFSFSGSPDLSEVMVGNYLRVHFASDIENAGDFPITAIDDGAKTITVSSKRGKTNGSSVGRAETLPFFGAYSIECTEDTTGLSVTEDYSDGAAFDDMSAGTGQLGSFFTEVTLTGGQVTLKLA